jgi:hypothetical protein
MVSKRLGLLREFVPGVPLIGVLVNPRFPPTEQELLDLEPAAKAVDQMARANDDSELDAALASFVDQRVGALLVTAAPSSTRGSIASSALRRRSACRRSISSANTQSPEG